MSARIAGIMLWLLATLAASAHAQTVEYMHTDALGSVVAVTNASRTVLERREYEPYGSQLTPGVSNGPGYTGHVQDAATGLVYMQQRYYDAILGRFLSVDPVTAHSGDTRHFNRYAYAYNNSYSFTDPDGRAPNQAGVTSPLHVYNELRRDGLAALRNTHGDNTNRYFYTQTYGWVDIRHFAEAARLANSDLSPGVVRALGYLNEMDQWRSEWGDDYRSAFSPEDIPSNEAGIDFGGSIGDGESLASAFFRWAKVNGAALDPEGDATGYQNLPATDPAGGGGKDRGASNASTRPPAQAPQVVRVNGRIDSMRLRRANEEEKK